MHVDHIGDARINQKHSSPIGTSRCLCMLRCVVENRAFGGKTTPSATHLRTISPVKTVVYTMSRIRIANAIFELGSRPGPSRASVKLLTCGRASVAQRPSWKPRVVQAATPLATAALSAAYDHKNEDESLEDRVLDDCAGHFA